MVIEDISRKVAKQLNLPIGLVDEIHRSQYQYLVDTMKECDKNVHLIYIGKFVKKHKRNVEYKRNISRVEESDIPDTRD